MRVIFINRFFYPDHSATSQMLSDLAFGLAERDFDVTVITSRLRYDAPSTRLPAQETVSGVRIERIWTSRFGRNHLLFRAIDYLTFYASVVWTLLRTARTGDVVVAMTDPPALSIVAALAARWRGAHLVNWLQDMFPEVAEVLGGTGQSMKFLLAPVRWLRNGSLRAASANVAIGELMAERVRNLGVSPDRTVVLPNWADTNSIRDVPSAACGLRSAWSLNRKFVVAHSRNLGRAHDFETLLGAMTVTAGCSGDRDIHWLLIGGGALYERLECESTRRELGNVTFRPYQPRECLGESLSVADAHIVSLKPALEGLIVPSKFYGIAAVGRPVLFIGCRKGEIARLIDRYDCGMTVADGDVDGLVASVRLLAQDRQRGSVLGARARAMCEEHFSKDQAIDAWSRLIGVVARPSPAVCSTAVTQPQDGMRKSSRELAG